MNARHRTEYVLSENPSGSMRLLDRASSPSESSMQKTRYDATADSAAIRPWDAVHWNQSPIITFSNSAVSPIGTNDRTVQYHAQP